MIRILYIILVFTLFSTFTSSSQSLKSKCDFTVAHDGKGDFLTIQEAIDSIPDLRNVKTTVFIKNGIYNERLHLNSNKTNVSLIGESVDKTIVTCYSHARMKNRFGEEIGTSGSSGFFVYGNNFIAENITFENTGGSVAQAVAVRIDGDKIIFKNCRFKGFIDTLYPHGEKSRQYYKNCTIEGAVDFIFGWSTAVFDSCNIILVRGNGFITAASTQPETKYGFVFLHCKITGDVEKNSVYLGRPWRPYAKVVYIKCYFDKIIKPEGWHNWDKPECEQTAYYAEYNNYGPGADTTKRVKWSHQLTKEEAGEYTLEKIFGDWVPQNFIE
jgi:pectinesterase